MIEQPSQAEINQWVEDKLTDQLQKAMDALDYYQQQYDGTYERLQSAAASVKAVRTEVEAWRRLLRFHQQEVVNGQATAS